MTAEEAILKVMRADRRECHIRDVERRIEAQRLGVWKAIGTAMADLTYPPPPSSSYPPERCFLVRKAKGVYALREGW